MAFRKFSLALSVTFARDIRRLLFISYGFWIVLAAVLVAAFSKGGLKNWQTADFLCGCRCL